MKIVILNVGKVRQEFIRQGEQEYLQRLRGSPYQLEVRELGMEAPESLSPQQVQERESVELLKKVKEFDYLVVLDERGKQMTSHQFSSFLEDKLNRATKSLCFVIGGAYGVSDTVRQHAKAVLSLSPLTFPHQVTRLILVEQIYRAHTLLKGIQYHK